MYPAPAQSHVKRWLPGSHVRRAVPGYLESRAFRDRSDSNDKQSERQGTFIVWDAGAGGSAPARRSSTSCALSIVRSYPFAPVLRIPVHGFDARAHAELAMIRCMWFFTVKGEMDSQLRHALVTGTAGHVSATLPAP